MGDTFYLRYMILHDTKDAGKEELSFEINTDGLLHYLNRSSYRKARDIRKEAYLSTSVIDEFKKIIDDSQIVEQNDLNWPPPTNIDSQELEIVIGKHHISFNCGKLNTLAEIQRSNDPNGLSIYYYLIQDLKSLVFSLLSLHFKINPIP